MNEEERQRNIEKKFGHARRTGGKGTRRQVVRKQAHRSKKQDDKRLQSALKKLNVNNIPAIEEVNLFKEDGMVVHFENPTVQASIGANTYVVSGECDTKSIKDLLPGILPHLGPESLDQLKDLVAEMPGADFGAMPGATEGDDDDSDGDIPELVGNFEDASKISTGPVIEEVDDDNENNVD